MYRRGDPRWNRTIQNITDTVEHANESAQEGLYSFTHLYINPCLSSVTQCLNACTAPCFPSQNDRRRHRARSRGRAELSFDFYDDWEQDESDGLLGWGNDNLDRLWGNSGHSGGNANAQNYGTVSQPRQHRAMSYGNRNRDARYNAGRRKSAVHPHDGGPDPTIIPSSSYFGFLGRLPFKVGGKVLRYKPSAADLTEHPGQSRRNAEEARMESQPLIEDSDEEAVQDNERKIHGRKRSQTSTSGHTTDSFSSRGDIFPSEDELDDAVPLDDEFAVALERRTTRELYDDNSSGKSKVRSESKSSKRPAESRRSTRSVSSRTTQESATKKPYEANTQRPHSDFIEEMPTLADLKQEEERVRIQEEAEIQRKRHEAQTLALRRGLTSSDQLLKIPPTNQTRSPSPPKPGPSPSTHPAATSPLLLRTAVEQDRAHSQPEEIPKSQGEDAQTRPDSSAFYVDESDYSSLAPTPNRPLSIHNELREADIDIDATNAVGDEPLQDSHFVPARLPHFGPSG